MTLSIGKTIKRLRREKGITQETLAEQMHISSAAVSKWERGETLPDISMVIPLASYFGVSTDEILGVDEAKNLEKVRAYLDEYHRLGRLGRVQEKFDLMANAYREFPNDWRIVEEYMWQLNYDPNCADAGDAHKEELYRLCERVLDECSIDRTRYAALSILGGLYRNDGRMDLAIETAGRFPDYAMTRGEEMEHLYVTEDGEHVTDGWWGQLRENIMELTQMLLVKVRNAALTDDALSPAEQIAQLEKAVTLIGLVCDEGDYGFFHYHLAELHIWIANRYALIGAPDTAVDHYERGLAHAAAYDTLPPTVEHTSYLLRGLVQDMAKTTSTTEANQVACEINFLLGSPVYPKVKDLPRMKALMEKYKPLMGKKNDRR